jgi:hypothetical protein
MARKKGRGLSSKIRGGALAPHGPKSEANPKFHRKDAKLNSRGRKNRKIGSGRM